METNETKLICNNHLVFIQVVRCWI